MAGGTVGRPATTGRGDRPQHGARRPATTRAAVRDKITLDKFIVRGNAIEESVKTLLTAQQLHEGVTRLAKELTAVYGGQPLTIVGVMTGSVVLLADLIRLLEMPLRVGVLQASSYRGAVSRGELSINATMMLDITNRDILLVDDIFDTGHTLSETVQTLRKLQPTSLRTCVLLLKKGRQEVTMKPDFVGFEIPDEFVVGYGLDYQDHYRNLPYLAVLTPEESIGEPQMKHR
jgi:hypoxanthine phosphoribosyltransferase